MKRKVKKKFINLLFIYILLLSPKLIINTYSKYQSINYKQGNISIAKWNNDTLFSSNDVNLVSGNTTDDYILTINSLSEVGCEYKIILSNVPNDLLVSFNDSDYIEPNNNKIIFNNYIEAGRIYQENIVLHFKSLIDLPNLDNYKIKIDVVFSQIGGV